MKTLVTLTRVYKKEVTIEIDPKQLESMGVGAIHAYIDEVFENDTTEINELFEKSEFEKIGFNEDYIIEDVDADKFEITDKFDRVLYSGYL